MMRGPLNIGARPSNANRMAIARLAVGAVASRMAVKVDPLRVEFQAAPTFIDAVREGAKFAKDRVAIMAVRPTIRTQTLHPDRVYHARNFFGTFMVHDDVHDWITVPASYIRPLNPARLPLWRS